MPSSLETDSFVTMKFNVLPGLARPPSPLLVGKVLLEDGLVELWATAAAAANVARFCSWREFTPAESSEKQSWLSQRSTVAFKAYKKQIICQGCINY